MLKGALVNPQPLEQLKLSKQLPGMPQSAASVSVVAQNPQTPFRRSTRASNPLSADRGLEASPVEKMVENLVTVPCRLSSARAVVDGSRC